jgi:hypothetical protein
MVALDPRGETSGRPGLLDNGLAIDLSVLDPASGPYSIRLQNDQERIDGSLFLCPSWVEDCYDYDPRRDLCGVGCRDVGNLCCVDATTGAMSCEDVRTDEDNCGGCGTACEWDEVCLDGVCAVGEGMSCWETECPEGMYCVSDVPFFKTNPKCKALLVDNENCGWYGHECAENRACISGLCQLRRRTPCNGECLVGETCCWVLGVETCVDMLSDPFHCGSCGTICECGNLCDEGQCVPWTDVLDPCEIWGQRNCGLNGEIQCVDISSDPDHCGSCGVSCSERAVCSQGYCKAPIERDIKEGEE